MPPRGDKVKPKQQFSAEWQKRIRHLDKLLAAKGFDPYSRAGIIGNALQESGINPDSVNHYGYSGVWQNSKEIRRAIEDQYGDYSLQSQLRYLDDWTSGSTWVKKGKHRDHTALYSGSFKKTGYKSAQEASEAFQKLYERAVIKDKNGKVIGYQDWDKRNNYANQVYEWLHGTPQTPQESELVQQLRANEWKPQQVLKPVTKPVQDYNLNIQAPQSLNAYNMPESPSYTTRLPDIQQFMNAVMSDQYQPQYTPIQTTNQVQPAILPDGNKMMKFSGFRYGKLPIYPKYII